MDPMEDGGFDHSTGGRWVGGERHGPLIKFIMEDGGFDHSIDGGVGPDGGWRLRSLHRGAFGWGVQIFILKHSYSHKPEPEKNINMHVHDQHTHTHIDSHHRRLNHHPYHPHHGTHMDKQLDKILEQ